MRPTVKANAAQTRATVSAAVRARFEQWAPGHFASALEVDGTAVLSDCNGKPWNYLRRGVYASRTLRDAWVAWLASSMAAGTAGPGRFVGENDATGYLERFVDALEIMCTERPDSGLCEQWLRNAPEGDCLQDWTVDHMRANWGTGIGVLDAASAMAESPEEGMDHEGFRADFLPAAEGVAEVDTDSDESLSEVASNGVIAAAELLIAADRAQVLTTEHIDGLENAIAIQRGELKLPSPNEGGAPDMLLQLEAGTTIKRWIRAHKVSLNEVEFGRIDAAVERLMMHLAMANAERVTAASAAMPVYRFLQAGDTIHATDECIADDFVAWKQVDQHYADRLAGREMPAGYGGIARGMPYTAGMKAVRRVVACAAVETDAVTIGGSVYRRAGGFLQVADGRNLPVFIAEGHPDERELGERDDAIARSKRILALVDEYTERPTSANRTELRTGLMNEFTLLLAAAEPWTVARAHGADGPVVTLFGYFRKNGKRWDQLKGTPNPETIKTGWVPFFAPQAVISEGDQE